MADEVEEKVNPEIKEDEAIEQFQNGQLSYIGQNEECIPTYLAEKYSSISKRFDLSFNQLKSLSDLERFQNLEELVLDNNRLSDDVVFPRLNHLHTLTLNKNCITDLYHLLDNLAENVPSLTYLSLLGNLACPNQLSSPDNDEEDYQRYRYYVLYKLPKLKFLDSTPVKQEELLTAKEKGAYMKVIKAEDSELISDPKISPETDDSNYSPLPQSARNADQHSAAWGKSKYVYYGNHSEGNRFIRNPDL
ncbi:leucine-rich melanocyte differentiation-associated protein-like [Mytilus galloprovincialis]|uniref:leucine-rich melanocyte differentiation-associated protein-like n=1 Tax=Mytilus galloprovincialis TaxID=29158 RepID=UPI003F7C44E5